MKNCMRKVEVRFFFVVVLFQKILRTLMARGLLCVIPRLEGFNTMGHQHGISCLVRQEVVLELQELREQVKQIKEVPMEENSIFF